MQVGLLIVLLGIGKHVIGMTFENLYLMASPLTTHCKFVYTSRQKFYKLTTYDSIFERVLSNLSSFYIDVCCKKYDC